MFNELYKDKKILITGDTGFKGSWLAIWLKTLGAKVFGYSLPVKTEMDNFSQCGLSEIIEHQDGDIRDYEGLWAYFELVKPEIVFHLAAQPIVLESYQNPKYTFETNVTGTINLFECIRKSESVKVAINVTSDKCYRNNEWIWGYREEDAMGGKDPYSASKGASEIITQSYIHSFFSDEKTPNIASVRAGNVIGGGDWAEFRIVPDFFRAITDKKALQLRYPEATRPWQHVLEPLSGYLALAAQLYSEGGKYSGGWNFGPLDSTNKSVRDLVEKMIEYSGEGRYEAPELNEKYHEASLLNLDISKAIHQLKWKPTLDFDKTVEFTVEGYLFDNKKNIYELRLEQIEQYTRIAREKNIMGIKINCI